MHSQYGAPGRAGGGGPDAVVKAACLESRDCSGIQVSNKKKFPPQDSVLWGASVTDR